MHCLSQWAVICLWEISIHHWHEGVYSAHPCSAAAFPFSILAHFNGKPFLKPCQPFASCNKQQQQNAAFTPAAISKQTSLWKAEKAAPALVISPDFPHLLQAWKPLPAAHTSSSLSLQVFTYSQSKAVTSPPPGALLEDAVPSGAPTFLPVPSPQHGLFFLSNMTWERWKEDLRLKGGGVYEQCHGFSSFFLFLILLVGFNLQRYRKGGLWIWRVRMILTVACLRAYVRGD